MSSTLSDGTAPSNGIQQNRRQVNESATSRHSNSHPSLGRNSPPGNTRRWPLAVVGIHADSEQERA